MPIITVALYSGRSQREKDRLAEAIRGYGKNTEG